MLINSDDTALKELKDRLFGRNVRSSKKFFLVLDIVACGLGNGIPDDVIPAFVNDSRKDINSSKQTNEDKKIQNCEFVCTLVNGWPSIFLITTKDIIKGEYLWCYYGSIYHKALKQSQEYKENANEKKDYVVDVLGNDNFDNQQIPYYV